MVTHQAGNAVLAHPPALATQGRMHTRAAIDGTIVGMSADVGGKSPIRTGPGTVRPITPRIVAAGTDLQHSAQRPHRKGRTVILDEAEPHLGGPEKMLTAFFKMSRSI